MTTPDTPAELSVIAGNIPRVADRDLSETTVIIYDKFWTPVREAAERISLTARYPKNEVPTLELVMPQGSPSIPLLRKCRDEVVGVTVEFGDERWAFTVDTAHYVYQGGQKTLTAKCLGIYDYLQYLLVWPNFLTPIWFQGPLNKSIYFGPICTVIETMISEQALRMQTGLNEFVNNAGSLNPDIRSWFGTVLESNGNLLEMLTTPVYVVHHNPLIDTSPTVNVTGRMDTCKAVIDKVAPPYGVVVDVELWLPGDEQPDEWSKLVNLLKVPTYVVRVRDEQGVTGPTGTMLDGVIRQAVDLEQSLLGDVLDPILNPGNSYAPTDTTGVQIAPTLGVDFQEPWAVLVDHPDGPMESFEIVDHHPQGWQIVIGGKSPKWLDDLINSTLEWLIEALQMLIGIAGIPSTLLNSVFSDMFLAFQLLENFDRRNKAGPYAKPEKFVSTGAAPYNVDALFTFVSTLWDTRGYSSAMATFWNGYPYRIGRDIRVGSLMSIVVDKEMYTDYIEAVMIQENRSQPVHATVQIGDGKAIEAPIVRQQRLVNGLMEDFNLLTLSV